VVGVLPTPTLLVPTPTFGFVGFVGLEGDFD
jgi:hypothetical protein